MTEMHRVEDAARLAMAGVPDLETPRLRPRLLRRGRSAWLSASLALASAAIALWLIV